ncbi:Ent-kaurenoic acid oxidase 1 [Platanthera guangdongensis]|uniref:Ent-kaurenoic acid oxidase 1 n=1 Tax=Platanthera guangdongensis TaxID=2320717 RepID=A0ABR2MB48_9ASPA
MTRQAEADQAPPPARAKPPPARIAHRTFKSEERAKIASSMGIFEWDWWGVAAATAAVAVVAAAAAGLRWAAMWLHEWAHERKLGDDQRRRLPPGDLGLPFIGNMWAFLRAFKSGAPDYFIDSFVRRIVRPLNVQDLLSEEGEKITSSQEWQLKHREGSITIELHWLIE